MSESWTSADDAWAALEQDVILPISERRSWTPEWRAQLALAHHAELDARPGAASSALAALRTHALDPRFAHVADVIAARIEVRSGVSQRVESAIAAARELSEALADREPSTAARAAHVRGVACVRLGLLGDAEDALGELLSRSLPSPFSIWVMDSFIQALVGRGAWIEGGRAMASLFRMRRASGDPIGAAITAGNLARLYAEIGSQAASRAVASEALANLPATPSALTRLRLQTFVTMAALEDERDPDDATTAARALESAYAKTSEAHYLRGYAALTLSKAATKRGDASGAARWLEAARAELTLPGQRTLLMHYEVQQNVALLDEPTWLKQFEEQCLSVNVVTDGEMRIRTLLARRAASGAARHAALEILFERATSANNAIWTKWADDAARELDADFLGERLAQRFSGWRRADLDRTAREDVTIVFADLAGFTARAVELDPEEVMSTVRGLFELAMPVMLAHAVSPITYMGDGLLAIARGEDHERRGLTFARALLDRAGRVTALRRLLGDPWPLDLRAGVASGPVVLGTLGSALKFDFAAIGLTTNLAARLQAAASPQEVVCSERTAQRANIETEYEPLQLKGFEKVGPVRACRIRCTGAR